MKQIYPPNIDVSKKNLNIALDWDDTYTADPDLWNVFINMAHLKGHKVYIVTARHEASDPVGNPPYIAGKVYTEGHPKRAFCASLGLTIDIFIDDAPEGIVRPSATTG